MNKEEVKFDHFKDIEELIKHLEMWYAEDDYFAYERYFHLRDARIMGMFIYELQQENKQLKLDYELYKDNCVYRNYEVEIRDNTIKQLKEVIEEVREYMEKHPCDTWYYSKKKSDKFLDIEIIRCDEELLQILDKVKENK